MVKIESSRGSMSFRSHAASWEFTTKIEQWAGFPTSQWLTREEAVEYHLAYCEGGVPAVMAVYAARIARLEAEAMAEAHRKAVYEVEKQHRYAMASMMPKESHEYRSHFDSWYPYFKWGA